MKRYYLIIIILLSYFRILYCFQNLPISIEITEDAINLFLLKQYEDLGEDRYYSGNYNGQNYTITLLPFEIELLNDAAKLYWNFKISLYSTEYTFSDNITFAVPSNKLTLKMLCQNFVSKVLSLGLPDAIENDIINNFKNLNLLAYQDDLISLMENDDFFKQHPIEFLSPYFQLSFDCDINLLKVTLTTKLDADQPKLELKIIDEDNASCRMNFEGRVEYMFFYKDINNSFAYTDFSHILPYSNTHSVNWEYFDLDDSNYSIIVISTGNKIYKGYFDCNTATIGQWFEPYLFIK